MADADDSFPVVWPDAEAPGLLWRHDRTHAPNPVSTLTGDLGARSLEAGFNRAAEAYALPLRVRWARFNTYSYQAVIQFGSSTAEMTELHQAAERRLRPLMQKLRRMWDDTWLPEIQTHLAFWDGFPARAASMEDCLAHLDETERRFARVWEIHFLLGIPFLLAPSMFEDFYTDLFGEERRFDAYRMIEGSDNKIVESERALWDLSRVGKASPNVRRVLETEPAASVLSKLRETEGAADFLAGFQSYLERFGERSSEFLEFVNPSWIEDPTPVVNCLQDYISQADRERDAELAAAEQERSQELSKLRELLATYPAKVRDEFESLLRAAREGSFLHSEHAHWIDQGCAYRVRRLLLEFGRRFAAKNALAHEGDIFFLKLAEIRETARGAGGDRRALVLERQQEMEKFQAIAPPVVLGTLPTQAPPETPIHRAMTKFIGGPARRSSDDSHELAGNSASPGKVSGRARVVHSLSDGGKMEPGDILVARTMAPPWAPLLASAAGIVTDTGGVLSHCAVIAREYRIPAVVGTGVATKCIADGQEIEVDGGLGLVRLGARIDAQNTSDSTI